MFEKLPQSFYLTDDVVQLSQDLLGKYLVTKIESQYCSGRIVETEAYQGPDDKACHAYNNKYTKRTKVMFEPGGRAYVYLCYGIHHLFNVVSAKKGKPHAVLIRAIEPIDNIELMMERRNFKKLQPQLTAGPGVMSKALGITTAHTNISLCDPNSPIWLESRENPIKKENIIASPRVGVGYAEEYADWPWRFRIKKSKWTSKAR